MQARENVHVCDSCFGFLLRRFVLLILISMCLPHIEAASNMLPMFWCIIIRYLISS